MRFVYVYVLKLGFLDGMAGLRYSMMLVVYEYMISLNLSELRYEEFRAQAEKFSKIK